MAKRYFMVVLVILLASLSVVGCGVPQEDYTAAIAEAAAAKSQLSSLQSDLNTARTELNAAQDEVDELQDDLEETEADLAEALDRLSPLQSQVASLQLQVSSLQNENSSLESSLASAEAVIAARQTQLLDQSVEPFWSGGFHYITATSQAGQSFISKYSVLTAVEVKILTASPDRGDDSITMKILDSSNAVYVSRVLNVASGFDGWLRFEIDGGVQIPVNTTLVIRIEDGGNSVFGWKLIPGNPYTSGTTIIRGLPEDSDFLFRTYGIPPQ
jgi:Skp family chaperone for outer membrane proteins